MGKHQSLNILKIKKHSQEAEHAREKQSSERGCQIWEFARDADSQSQPILIESESLLWPSHLCFNKDTS